MDENPLHLMRSEMKPRAASERAVNLELVHWHDAKIGVEG
jgi:hypothetical protein